MGDGNGHTATVTFTVTVNGIDDEAPTMTSHTNMAIINQDENDETSTAVAITLEGNSFLFSSINLTIISGYCMQICVTLKEVHQMTLRFLLLLNIKFPCCRI